jgi:hypothetical protein
MTSCQAISKRQLTHFCNFGKRCGRRICGCWSKYLSTATYFLQCFRWARNAGPFCEVVCMARAARPWSRVVGKSLLGLSFFSRVVGIATARTVLRSCAFWFAAIPHRNRLARERAWQVPSYQLRLGRSMRGTSWNYISRCAVALTAYGVSRDTGDRSDDLASQGYSVPEVPGKVLKLPQRPFEVGEWIYVVACFALHSIIVSSCFLVSSESCASVAVFWRAVYAKSGLGAFKCLKRYQQTAYSAGTAQQSWDTGHAWRGRSETFA